MESSQEDENRSDREGFTHSRAQAAQGDQQVQGGGYLHSGTWSPAPPSAPAALAARCEKTSAGHGEETAVSSDVWLPRERGGGHHDHGTWDAGHPTGREELV